MLEGRGITADARILRIADVADDAPFVSSVAEKAFPAVSDEAALRMRKAISDARDEGDSVGGIIECVIRGVPAGLGEPMFDGVENRIAQLMFAVPAVKGIEFGAGFAAAGSGLAAIMPAESSAALQTAKRLYFGPRSNRLRPLQNHSRASIWKPCSRRRFRLRDGTIPVSFPARCRLRKRLRPSQLQI